jgi:hypothetical protein
MSEQSSTVVDTNVCYVHPDRETYLRCNRCERPMCTACAVLTPTGYRCKNCVRGGQKAFETTQLSDYPIAVIIAAAISLVGSGATTVMGFFTIFLAPVFGVLIAGTVRWAVRKRRSPLLYKMAAGGALLGALPLLLIRLMGVLFSLLEGGSMAGLFGVLWPGLYAFLVVSTVYYRLSGIQIR